MDAILLKCPRNGRFHFGVAAPDHDTALSQSSVCFHSDTLFSALIVMCRKAFPEEINSLIDCFDSGGIKISSGQYCIDVFENDQFSRRLYFLPKPAHLDLLNKNLEERKKMRGIQYVSKTIWEKGLNPSQWTSENYYTIDGGFLVAPEDLNPKLGKMIDGFYQLRTEPKIADHQRKKEDNIFSQTDVSLYSSYLSKEDLKGTKIDLNSLELRPHFYFLLEWEEGQERMKNLLLLLVEILKDEGLGGAVSTGCGKIEAVERIKNWQLDFKGLSTSEKQLVSLSVVGLVSEEVPEVKAANLIIRGGRRIGADDQLKRAKMLTPGALLTDQVKGCLIKLHPSQPHLRYGKVFPISISKNYELH